MRYSLVKTICKSQIEFFQLFRHKSNHTSNTTHSCKPRPITKSSAPHKT